MRRLSAWILALAVAAGATGSAVAYARTSPGLPPDTGAPAAATSAVRQQPAATKPAQPRTVVRWAPCAPGTQLEHGTCVREVVRTVTLPASPAPPAPAAPAAQPAPAASAAPPPAASASATTSPVRHDGGDRDGDGDRHEGKHDDDGPVRHDD